MRERGHVIHNEISRMKIPALVHYNPFGINILSKRSVSEHTALKQLSLKKFCVIASID